MPEYTNRRMQELIDDYVHNADDRKMLVMRLIDGLTFEQIAFNMKMTTKTVRTHIHEQEEILFKHI